jgi:hypothetical protein
MKKTFIIISLLILGCNILFAQGTWELKKNENGIKVYTRTAATGNIHELRVVCELDGNKNALIGTLRDIPGYPNWVFSNKKSTVLKTESQDQIIYYTQSHLPWPLKDRDLIIELNITNTANGFSAQAKSLSGYMPDNKNYIRVPYSLSVWKVEQASTNKMKVDYTFSVDPGGSIPSWIVNATLTVGPFNSFLKLRDMMRVKYGGKDI